MGTLQCSLTGHLAQRKAQRIGDALAISSIGAPAIADVADLDFFRCSTDRARRILEQGLLLRRAHQAEQGARLRVIVCVLAVAVVPVIGRPGEAQRRVANTGNMR